MNQAQHFARTLRPQKLSEVIGQDCVVSMLQNSIYMGRFFPVYLFHGQRGCGKTTVARILATMINCSKLEEFRKIPLQTDLPCTTCPSCIASRQGSHPDFIEIDAASHTGVDHVRTILESAQYLPLMGQKKIYLIDEAHMLSKAAFNALLKMLEEPPASALFILATTEINKIPLTVRSRAFQGIFNAPERSIITNYLKTVAQNHNLKIDDEAANLLVTKADRCVRDALNLLEQLGSVHSEITASIVTNTLGMAEKSHIIAIMDAVISGNASALFTGLETSRYSDKNPTHFWQALSEGFQSLVRVHFKAPAIGTFATYEKELSLLVSKTNQQQLAIFNAQFWNAEKTFNTTTAKHLFIEHFLSSLCNPQEPQTPNTRSQAELPERNTKTTPSQQHKPEPHINPSAKNSQSNVKTAPQETDKQFQKNTSISHVDKISGWESFLEELNTLNDKVPFSIFKRAQASITGSTLLIQITNYNSFLDEQLSDRSALWKKCLTSHLPPATTISIKAAPLEEKTTTSKNSDTQALGSRNLAEGPTTDLIMKYFPGKLV
jgi:DNA polymerase III subunit gamma/tau